MIPRLGVDAFIACIACGMRPFGFNASEAHSVLFFGLIFGNSAIAGMPRSVAFFASETISSRFTHQFRALMVLRSVSLLSQIL